jgi:lysozyme family protein
MDRFRTFIERLLDHEGGYVNNPADPGGETKWGISKRTYPALDIRGLSREEAIEIYRRDFWDRSEADLLPAPVGFQLLDGAVNSGIAQASRWLQRAVGVADDGDVGPITLAAIRKADPADLVMQFNAERLDFMTRLSTWSTFGRGWARRIAANLRYGAEDTPR